MGGGWGWSVGGWRVGVGGGGWGGGRWVEGGVGEWGREWQDIDYFDSGQIYKIDQTQSRPSTKNVGNTAPHR